MQNDYITLNKLLKELQNEFLNSKIDSFQMPDNDRIIIGFNNKISHKNLLISANPTYPRIHITNIKIQGTKNNHPFLLQIKKILTYSKLTNLSLFNDDRIFLFEFLTEQEFKNKEKYFLLFEFMGRFSNIFLLNKDFIILNSLKQLSYDKNSKRDLYIGAIYKKFRNTKKQISKIEINDLDGINKNNIDTFLCYKFNGISNKSAFEIKTRVLEDNFSKLKVFEEIKYILNNNEAPYLENKESNQDILLYNFKSISEDAKFKKNSMSEIYDSIFFKIDKDLRLKTKTKSFLSKTETKLKKLKRAYKNNELLLEKENKIETYKHNADLIMSNFYLFKDKEKEINIKDYEKNEIVKIILDDTITLKENAQKLYKNYNKLKRQKEHLLRMQNTIKDDILILEQIIFEIKNVKDKNEILDIKELLIQNNILQKEKVKLKHNKKVKIKDYKPNIKKLIIDNFIVYIGRNSIQNSYITFKLAKPDDIWLHVKDYPSSHAIIQKNNQEISCDTLQKVAQELLIYSQLEKDILYTVDYTLKKHVKRISKTLSNVVYKNYKSINIKI